MQHLDRLELAGVCERPAAWGPDADRPPMAVRPTTGQIEVAARINSETAEGPQFVCRHVDGQSLGDGPQVENHRPTNRHCAPITVEADVAEAHVSVPRDRRGQTSAAPMLAVEPTALHRVPHRRIECAATLLGDRERKLHRMEKQGADGDGDADL